MHTIYLLLIHIYGFFFFFFLDHLSITSTKKNFEEVSAHGQGKPLEAIDGRKILNVK